MTTRQVAVRDLEPYMGRWIDFDWSDGWDDYYESGYLLGWSDWVNEYGSGPRKVLHISRETDLEGEAPESLGGYACPLDHMVTVKLT